MAAPYCDARSSQNPQLIPRAVRIAREKKEKLQQLHEKYLRWSTMLDDADRLVDMGRRSVGVSEMRRTLSNIAAMLQVAMSGIVSLAKLLGEDDDSEIQQQLIRKGEHAIKKIDEYLRATSPE